MVIILFKILIVLGVIGNIYTSNKVRRLISGKDIGIPGLEIRPEINIEGLDEENAAKLKKSLGWAFVIITDLLAIFKLYVVTWLI